MTSETPDDRLTLGSPSVTPPIFLLKHCMHVLTFTEGISISLFRLKKLHVLKVSFIPSTNVFPQLIGPKLNNTIVLYNKKNVSRS